MPVELVLAATSEEIRQSLIRFNSEAKRSPARALSLLQQTTYWVHDDDSESFGPAKFVGFADMSFAKYEQAIDHHHTGAPFDGFATRRAIESVATSSFARDELLRSKLGAWGASLLGPTAFEGVDQSKWAFVRLTSQRNYWAFMSNPETYDIEKAVVELERDDWTVRNSKVRAGDRFAIWKAKGRSEHRGVIALGEVLSDPASRTPLLESHQYARDPTFTAMAQERVLVRYTIPPCAPVWMEQDKTGLLARLSVSRATGGTVFKIAPEHWHQLVTLLGGWRTGAPSADEAAVEAADVVRAKSRGFQADSAVRQAVEEYAMQRAEAHFVGLFESVKRKGKPYDLLCAKGASVLYVEVKGTQTEGTEILLTPNEVRFANEHRGEMALFLVYNVCVSREADKIVTSGGKTYVEPNWGIDTSRLSPLGYSYVLKEKLS